VRDKPWPISGRANLRALSNVLAIRRHAQLIATIYIGQSRGAILHASLISGMGKTRRLFPFTARGCHGDMNKPAIEKRLCECWSAVALVLGRSESSAPAAVLSNLGCRRKKDRKSSHTGTPLDEFSDSRTGKFSAPQRRGRMALRASWPFDRDRRGAGLRMRRFCPREFSERISKATLADRW
jgi:hypothetical protein